MRDLFLLFFFYFSFNRLHRLIVNWSELFVSVTTEIVPAVIASLDATIEKESDREAKIRLIERSSESLLHAVQCQDAACANPSCPKKKIFVEHSKTCKLKAVGGCTVCKQLVELCGYHSKNCQTDNCTFPLCSKLKRGIRLISEGWSSFSFFIYNIHESIDNYDFYCRQTQNGKTTSNGISVAEEPIVILEQVRKNAVSMLAMTMSPNTDLSGANNAKTCDLIARAHKMEQGIFEMAKTDTEYHKILIDQVKCLAEANLSASLETLQKDLSDSKMV